MKRFREKRVEDTKKPVLLRLGVALAVPLASYLASNLTTHSSFDSAAGDDKQLGTEDKSGAAGAGANDSGRRLKNELYILRNQEALANVIRGTSVTPTSGKQSCIKITVEGSPRNKVLGNAGAAAPPLSLMRILKVPYSKEDVHHPSQEADQYPAKNEEDTSVPVRSPDHQLIPPQVISKPSVQAPSSSITSVTDCTVDGESWETEESLSPLLQEPESMVKPVDAVTARSRSKDAERVAFLSNMAKALFERERMVEIQTLEYCGMIKEQETAVRELESRLEMSSMEAKLLGLKLESLQDENRKLELEASKNVRTVQELDAERVKVQNLKRKLKSIRVGAREKLASLEQRIGTLLHQEHKWKQDDSEAQRKLKRLQELEDEAAELKRSNFDLERENLELIHKLERAQNSISTSLIPETQAKVAEEVGQLREANGELEKAIEQLQADRFADVEELVYLRWLNACLRYETKNHRAPPGKTIARELSSRLSPKSQEKAKQLILDYANESTIDEGNYFNFLQDLDPQYNHYSLLQGLSDEYNVDGLLDIPCMNKEADSRKKTKFFGKLKKLLVTRKSSSAPSSCASNSDRRESVSTRSVDDVARRSSSDNSSCYSEPQADHRSLNRGPWSMQRCGRPLLDATHMQGDQEGKAARCRSDLGASIDLRRIACEDEGWIGRSRGGSLDHQTSTPEKARLNKLAEALASARAPAGHVGAAYFLHS